MKIVGTVISLWILFSFQVEEDVEISDTDYNISSLFETPPKKRYSRRSRNSIVVTEVKRSQRIANKIAAAKLASAKK